MSDMVISVNIHLFDDTPIAISPALEEAPRGGQVVRLGLTYPHVAWLFFKSPDELRRLRDIIDAYLVGRLGEEA